MPILSFLKGVILTIPGGVGWVVGEWRNNTKLQPSSVEVELWLSLVINTGMMMRKDHCETAEALSHQCGCSTKYLLQTEQHVEKSTFSTGT